MSILTGRIVSLLIGYVFGLFQTGYIYGKVMERLDIRNYGSGNAGSTNVLRVLGKKAAFTVLLGDVFKAVFAMLLCSWMFRETGNASLFAMYAALGVTIGHDFPFYLGFKGGKGIASMAGIMSVMDLRMTLVCFILFVSIVFFTRYVSLGSILVSMTFCAMNAYFCIQGTYQAERASYPEIIGIAVFLTILAVWQHRANIGRLIAGNENKIGSKAAKDQKTDPQ